MITEDEEDTRQCQGAMMTLNMGNNGQVCDTECINVTHPVTWIMGNTQPFIISLWPDKH